MIKEEDQDEGKGVQSEGKPVNSPPVLKLNKDRRYIRSSVLETFYNPSYDRNTRE
jgi:hypothetical protein